MYYAFMLTASSTKMAYHHVMTAKQWQTLAWELQFNRRLQQANKSFNLPITDGPKLLVYDVLNHSV